ncbi:MAG: hypothetical protein LBN95_07300, partial [Prevotellaceae bacterium]|nr:hypothetical protein [Prevotellaceae bacterium]
KAKEAVETVFNDISQKITVENIDNFRIWLYSEIKSYCLKLTPQKSETLFEIDEKDEDFYNTLKLLNEKCTEKSFKERVKKLPVEPRVAILRFFYEEISYQDIADSTGYELKKVKNSVQKGVLKLVSTYSTSEYQPVENVLNLKNYISGIRSGQEINFLEREALQDKILAETLEGYDSVKGNHAQNVADLQQKIGLKKQKSKKNINSKIIFVILAFILLAVGIFIFIKNFNNIFPEKIENNIPIENAEMENININDTVQLADTLKIDTVKIEKKDTIIIQRINKKPTEKQTLEKLKFTPPTISADTPIY